MGGGTGKSVFDIRSTKDLSKRREKVTERHFGGSLEDNLKRVATMGTSEAIEQTKEDIGIEKQHLPKPQTPDLNLIGREEMIFSAREARDLEERRRAGRSIFAQTRRTGAGGLTSGPARALETILGG